MCIRDRYIDRKIYLFIWIFFSFEKENLFWGPKLNGIIGKNKSRKYQMNQMKLDARNLEVCRPSARSFVRLVKRTDGSIGAGSDQQRNETDKDNNRPQRRARGSINRQLWFPIQWQTVEYYFRCGMAEIGGGGEWEGQTRVHSSIITHFHLVVQRDQQADWL